MEMSEGFLRAGIQATQNCHQGECNTHVANRSIDKQIMKISVLV